MAQLDLRVKVAVDGAGQLQSLAGNLTKVGKALTVGVTAPLVAGAAAAFKFASDSEEAASKARTVFGKAFGSIEDDAKSMEDALSEAQFLDFAGTFGAIAQGMGATQQQAADLSDQWLTTAQDLSSFNNVPVEESLTAIRSALSGEFEPLKRFGLLLNVAKVEAKALEMGLIKEGEALTDNARLLATNQLILEGLGPATGDYARTADSAANSTKTLAANSADLGADLGETLLPVGKQLIAFLTGVVAAFTALPEPMQSTIVMVAATAAAIGPLLLVAGQLVNAFGAVRAGFGLLTAVLSANPYLILIAATAALVALIVANWDSIVRIVRLALGAIVVALKIAASAVIGVGEKIWTPLSEGFSAAIGAIKGIWNAFARWWNSIQIGVPAFDIPFVGTFGGFNIGLPDLPYLAEGGIVNQPTLAVIGERGPEAVVPLGSGGMGAVNNFTFHVQGEVDEERIVTVVERAQRLEKALSWG